MPWTYSGSPVIGGTAAQQRDAVRFLAQVNDEAVAPGSAITDEEIAFVLGQAPNVYIAAAMIAEIAAESGAGYVQSKTIGSLSITYGSRATYASLAASLRRRGGSYQLPSCGGLSRDESRTARRDTDLPRRFYQGQFAEPWPESELAE